MILYGGGVAANDGGCTGTDGGGTAGVVLKKGPWTAAEDEILAAYVREHGEGNWNAVQKSTGLARCGKSCRLRWANHLRPNLKKGAFSAEEERLIIQLHAHLGNKWARMAAQLPGRTDNEIKNFWNTRLKRLQRQGLPLYPPDIIPTHHHHQMYPQPAPPSSPLPSPTAVTGQTTSFPPSFTFQTTTTTNTTNNMVCPPPPPRSPTPCPSPTTPQPPSPVLSSSTPPPPPLSPHHHRFPTLPLFALPGSSSCDDNNNKDNNAFTFPTPSPPLLKHPPSLRYKRCFNANSFSNITTSSSSPPPNFIPTATSFNGPFSPLPKSSSYSSFPALPYSSPPTPTGTTSYHYNSNTPISTFPLSSFSLDPNSNLPRNSTPNPFYSVVRSKLPSNQTSPSSGTGLFDVTNLTEINEKQNQNLTNTGFRRSSCELLEDVLEEAEILASGGGVRPPKRRQLISTPQYHNNNSFGDFDSSNNTELKPNEDESLQMNMMQDDFAKFLDWGSDSGEISNGHSSIATEDNLMIDVQHLVSLFPVNPTITAATADEHNMNNTSCSWDNLPGIC